MDATQTLCLIPRDLDDRFCATTTGFLAQLFDLTTDLDVEVLALPSEFADPAETAADHAYVRLRESAERPDAFLEEAASITVNADDSALGVLLAGVGRGIRDHQYRELIDLADPLEGAIELVIGAMHAGIVPSGHLDQLKLMQTDFAESVADFAMRLARPYLDRDSMEGARKCWRKVLEVTRGASFDASYSLANSYSWTPEYGRAAAYLEMAETAARDRREHVFVKFARGQLALQDNDDDAALRYFRACVDVWPACGMAYVLLATTFGRRGDRVNALTALRTCLSLPDDEATELGDSKQGAEMLLRELGI